MLRFCRGRIKRRNDQNDASTQEEMPLSVVRFGFTQLFGGGLLSSGGGMGRKAFGERSLRGKGEPITQSDLQKVHHVGQQEITGSRIQIKKGRVKGNARVARKKKLRLQLDEK